MAVFKMIVAFFTLLPQIIAPISGSFDVEFYEDWSAEQAYTAEYAIELEKDPNSTLLTFRWTTWNIIPAWAKKAKP